MSPRKRKPPPTIAQLAREACAELARNTVRPAGSGDPDLRDSDHAHRVIASRLTAQLGRPVSRYQVRVALASDGKIGRRTHRADPVVVGLTLERAVLERARAEAKRAGTQLGKWMESAIEAQLNSRAHDRPLRMSGAPETSFATREIAKMNAADAAPGKRS